MSHFSAALDTALTLMRDYVPGAAVRADLAAFIGITPNVVTSWITGDTHPIVDHYDLVCAAIPAMRNYNPDPRLQSKPGPKTRRVRQPLPGYFDRAVKGCKLNATSSARNPDSEPVTERCPTDCRWAG